MYKERMNRPLRGLAQPTLAAALSVVFLTVQVMAAEQANYELGFPIGAQRYSLDDEKSRAAIDQEFGVEIQPLRLTAAGNMLDFRYRVIDPEKAEALHRPQVRPYLVEPDTKVRLAVPKTKIGSFRQGRNTAPQKDRVYTTLFANPGRRLKPGETITVVFGDLVLESMTVR